MDINHGEVLKTTENFQERFMKLKEEVKGIDEKYSPISEPGLEKVQERIEKMTKLLPVISAVHNQGMKERHWQEVKKQ